MKAGRAFTCDSILSISLAGDETFQPSASRTFPTEGTFAGTFPAARPLARCRRVRSVLVSRGRTRSAASRAARAKVSHDHGSGLIKPGMAIPNARRRLDLCLVAIGVPLVTW